MTISSITLPAYSMRQRAARIQRKIPEEEERMHHETQETGPAAQLFEDRAVAPWWHTGLLIAVLAGGSLLSAAQAHRAVMGNRHLARYGMAIVSELVLLALVWWGLRMRRTPMAEVLQFRRGWRAWGEDLGAPGIFWITSATILIVLGLLLRAVHLSMPQKTVMAL